MKRVWGNGLTGLMLLAAVAAASAAGPACVHDDSTIFVRDVLAPKYVTAGMACVFTADPTQTTIGEGLLDAALNHEYSAEFLVGNQIVSRGDPNQPQTETSFVTIEGAVVRVVDSFGNQLSTYTRPAAATVPPSSGTTPGYASLAVTIIDETSSASVPAGSRVVSYVRFFGHTLGGDSVESNEFGFPVDICSGCLVGFPPSEDDPALTEQPNCGLAGASSGTSATSIPCVLGQDLAIDCSACLSNPACRSGAGSGRIADAGGG